MTTRDFFDDALNPKFGKPSPFSPDVGIFGETRARRGPIDAGNKFGSRPGEYGAFFAVPKWWRGFVFAILTPPQFRMYAYLCSQTDAKQMVRPSGEQMKMDLNVKHNRSIYATINELVGKGFFLKDTKIAFAGRFHHQNVYQRPSIEYTLHRLLKTRKIDAWLMPTSVTKAASSSKKMQEEYHNRHGRTVEGALRAMLGQDVIDLHIAAAGPVAKRSVLIDALEKKMEALRKGPRGETEAEPAGADAEAVEAAVARVETAVTPAVPVVKPKRSRALARKRKTP